MIKTKEEPNYIKASGIANGIIEDCGIETPNQIELEKIALSRGLHVVEGPLVGADARLIRNGKKGLLRVKEGITDIGKKRFIIAHDIGHWELHENQSQWAMFIDSDLKGYLHSPMELEATIFASHFLMPTKMFRPFCLEVEPGIEHIKRLAKEFIVTITAATIRFIEECDYSCVAVFSENGKVTWWKANNLCPRIWIEKNQPIHKYSFAWECLESNDFEIKGGDLENPRIWCDTGHQGIYEESLKLGHCGVILTLLWII